MWNPFLLLNGLGRPDRGEPPCAARPTAAQAAIEHLLDDGDRQRLERGRRQFDRTRLTDVLITDDPARDDPDEIFDLLRWGGQFIFISRRPRLVEHMHRRYRDRPEFLIEDVPRTVEPDPSGRRPHACLVARKILLDRPDRLTDRHSYHVALTRRRASFVVVKEVPGLEQTIGRLTRLMPEADPIAIAKGGRKLVDKVFPLLLTREVAFLKILQSHLPERFRPRVPRPLAIQLDDRGLVRRVEMNWLRLATTGMTLLDFARQSAEMLCALHETVQIVHLDLRLDNLVLTEHGVGFVDFGSAMRIGEDLSDNRLLATLMDEMLSASQVHRDLRRLREQGRVTNGLLMEQRTRADPAVDLIYLTLQMLWPGRNPEFDGLIDADPESEDYRRLERLRHRILRPGDPKRPPCRTARDLAEAVDRVATRGAVDPAAEGIIDLVNA